MASALKLLTALPAPPIEALFAPLDRLRSRLLLAIAPRARSLVVDRERRVALTGSMMLVAALAVAVTAPLWLIAIGPIVWGIPHVVADVRYLVARPGHHKRPLILGAIAIGCALAMGGLGLRGGLIGAALAALVARGSLARKAIALAAIGALSAAAWRAGWISDVIFAHAHNAVAFALWWAWRRRETKLHLIPIAIAVLGCSLVMSGGADAILAWSRGLVSPWVSVEPGELARSLSPLPAAPWPARFLVLYAFAQSAHYVVWVRLMPEDDRPRPSPRSYHQTYRALAADVSALVLWIAVLSAVGLAAWALMSLGEARDGYIRAAFFHGHLELAAAVVLFCEGKLGRVGRGAEGC